MNSPTIAIVDDDPGVAKALNRLLSGRGFSVSTFASAETFLTDYRKSKFDCAIFDLSMPGVGGLELQETLRKEGSQLPVVFLTGEGDIPSAVTAMKGGAVNFLTKPVEAGQLFNALRLALIQRRQQQSEDRDIETMRERFSRLSPRESEVLTHVITGKLNKQIAADLKISEQTVKIHRMRITEKCELQSVAEIVRAAGILGIEPANS